jgi:DNA-binding HxlR family transcriptional regulator
VNRLTNRLPPGPLDAARRVASGIGLEQVLRLERSVDAVAEAAAENAVLDVGLEHRVTELERSLVPLLEARQRWLAEHAHSADSSANDDDADV